MFLMGLFLVVPIGVERKAERYRFLSFVYSSKVSAHPSGISE